MNSPRIQDPSEHPIAAMIGRIQETLCSPLEFTVFGCPEFHAQRFSLSSTQSSTTLWLDFSRPEGGISLKI